MWFLQPLGVYFAAVQFTLQRTRIVKWEVALQSLLVGEDLVMMHSCHVTISHSTVSVRDWKVVKVALQFGS